MYRGFDLKIDWNKYINDPDFKDMYNECLQIGKELYNEKRIQVKETLDNLILEDGSLDGTKMQNNWFPQIKSDIFISHSHKDEEKAIFLAGMLSEVFGLELFVDSCIWGNANDLLKEIDKNYCFNEKNDTYYYEKRNYSTSHVHMILSTALTMMIDKTECLFFLNTPNSISASDLIEQTESPWIYSEIAISQMIRKRNPFEHRLLEKSLYVKDSILYNENLKVKYELPLDHLTDIDFETIIKWIEYKNKNNIEDSLRALYDII